MSVESRSPSASTPPTLSVVTPAFNGAVTLPILHQRLSTVMAGEAIDWEWIVVDDHSSDATTDTLDDLAAREPRLRAVRLAHTHGSNTAIFCGLDEARGTAAVLLAADLHDPPEALPQMLRLWNEGADIVWAVSSQPRERGWFARASRTVRSRLAGLKAHAADATFFLADERVVRAALRFQEPHLSVISLLGWLGFRQAHITYVPAGTRSAAALPFSEKVDILSNTVTAFSAAPLRLGAMAGGALIALGAFLAVMAVLDFEVGPLPPLWLLLLSGTLAVGGLNLLFLGVIGEYLWRAISGSRARPPYVIDRRFGPDSSPAATRRSVGNRHE